MTVVEQALPAEAEPSAVPQPASGSTGSGSVVAVVMDFVGATPPQLDQLLESMGLRPEGKGLPGSLFQWSRRTQDGVRVTEVWQTRHHFEVCLREEIEPRLSEAGLGEPEITTYEVHTYLTQGPSADQEAGADAFAGPAVRSSWTPGPQVLASPEGR